MSAILVAAVVGGTVTVIGLVAHRLSKRAIARPAPEPVPVERQRFEVQLGDVISFRGRELWLKSGWRCQEGREWIATLWFADEAVVVSAPGDPFALCVCEEVPTMPATEPPITLELGTDRFARRRRIPIEITSLGAAARPPQSAALLSAYEGGSEEVWALTTPSWARAFRGTRVEERDYELWGGGRETLDR